MSRSRLFALVVAALPATVAAQQSEAPAKVDLTKARRRRPASALIALDLPALERPANAISGAPGAGSSRGSCTDMV